MAYPVGPFQLAPEDDDAQTQFTPPGFEDLFPQYPNGDLYDGVNVRISFLDDEPGRPAKTFTIDRALICSKSDFFRTTFEGDSVEAQTGCLILWDVRPAVFLTYQHWLVYDELDLLADDCNYDFLVRLWIFADKYKCPEFRQRVLEAVQLHVYQNQPQPNPPPKPEVVHLLYANSAPESALRKLLVEAHVYWGQQAEAERAKEELLKHPVEFIVDSHVLTSRLAAARDCEECRDRWPSGCWDHEEDDIDIGPFRDWCLFHEHSSEEEKSKCLERLEEEKSRFGGGFWGFDD